MIHLLMVLNFVLISVTSTEKTCAPCPSVPKLYDELGCIGILDDTGCCFERFDCRDLNSVDASKCHLRGKTYEDREYALSNYLPHCQPSCRCDAGPVSSRFNCPIFECSSLWWQPTYSHCTKMYSVDRCCPTPTCDLQILQGRITCQYQGNLYKEGDKFYPEDTPCYTCICDKNFDGLEPIASNRNCRKIDCGLELRHFHELRQGCVPIYFKTSSCCPHDFRCPNDKDEVIQLERYADVAVNPEKMCKYGNHMLHIGDSLNSEKPCIKCVCKHPPVIECIKTYLC